MKGKIITTLFALPFFSVGVWMLWSVSNVFVASYQMRDWIQVEARLSSGGYSTHRGDTILIYINPDDPSDAVIDRGARWAMIGFKSIFLFVFGGIGLGLLNFIWRAPNRERQV